MLLLLGLFAGAAPVAAQEAGDQDLARQLSNPVADLISVPFQFNYDTGFGTTDADRWLLNVQPVLPFSISEDWNLISRTVVPLVNLGALTPGGDSTTGVGNTTQSFFFSPKAPTAGGIIWGVGPVFGLPATDSTLGVEEWSTGITGVVLRQSGPWTVGALANQLWSFTGGEIGSDVNAAYLQPFVAYAAPQAVTLAVNSEASYDWNAEQWLASVNGTVGRIVKVGGLPVQFTGGVRYWIESPEFGPDGWGARFTTTILFPKGRS